MNIIRFKDILKRDDTRYNTYFKGKYAWWVNCVWAVPFDDMNVDEYITASQNNDVSTYENSIAVDSYQQYIDEASTEQVNNQQPQCLITNRSISSIISIDELKRFRTWLAQSLIYLKKDEDYYSEDSGGYGEKIDTMLNYYANNMYDNTVNSLTLFAYSQPLYTTKSHCDCNNNIFYSTSISQASCDPLEMYRIGIYRTMVETFSNVDFWLDKAIFCESFYNYIQGIINAGFPLKNTVDSQNLKFCDCSCIGDSQSTLTLILQQLLVALKLIMDGDVENNRNKIRDAFYSWSSQLYESMYWV